MPLQRQKSLEQRDEETGLDPQLAIPIPSSQQLPEAYLLYLSPVT